MLYRDSSLRMVGTYAKVGEQQLLPARMVAPAVWLDRDENGVDVFQRLRVFGFQHPAFLTGIVFVEDAEIQSLFLVRASSAPRLERTRVTKPRLRVQIVGVEDQRLGCCECVIVGRPTTI